MTGTDPLLGSPVSVATAADIYAGYASELRSHEVRVAQARASMTELEGAFSSALLARTENASQKLLAAAAAWDEAAYILRSHATAMERLAEQYRRLQAQLFDTESEWRLARGSAIASSPSGVDFGVRAPSGAEFDGNLAYLRRWQDAESHITFTKSRLADLMVERARLDQSTADRLAGISLVTELRSNGGSSVGASALGWFGEITDVTAHDLSTINDPNVVAALWASLSPAEQAALLAAVPLLLGSLAGLPPAVRVAANKINAAQRITAIRAEIAELTALNKLGGRYEGPGAHGQQLKELRAEVAYLERVQSGEVSLYLYKPDEGQIIEMFGDPTTADVIVSFMPGTNTTMDSIYTSGGPDSLTGLIQWESRHPAEGKSVAGFVVKQGDFPQVGNVLFEGPQYNGYAATLGTHYAAFSKELSVVAPHVPRISIEHSFGSAAGGVAETLGADFDARIMLAGIGMADGWQHDPDTGLYAMQASDDINHLFEGAQLGPLGYKYTPTESNGVTELPSGIAGIPGELRGPLVSRPETAIPYMGIALDHHNQIISGDESRNGEVLRQIRRIASEVSK